MRRDLELPQICFVWWKVHIFVNKMLNFDVLSSWIEPVEARYNDKVHGTFLHQFTSLRVISSFLSYQVISNSINFIYQSILHDYILHVYTYFNPGNFIHLTVILHINPKVRRKMIDRQLIEASYVNNSTKFPWNQFYYGCPVRLRHYIKCETFIPWRYYYEKPLKLI